MILERVTVAQWLGRQPFNPMVSGSNPGLFKKNFLIEEKIFSTELLLHDEQPSAITLRNYIFYMMKNQPASQPASYQTRYTVPER